MPADYAAIVAELRERRELSLATRLMLARKAYARTARYDGEIATELERLAANETVKIGSLAKLPERIHIALRTPAADALRRKSSSGSGALHTCGAPGSGTRGGEATAGEGAFLQQSCGPRRGLGAGDRVQAARRRHHQAQQSVRSGRAG